jgi:diguanylate cyclase (GGDEF)-like protein
VIKNRHLLIRSDIQNDPALKHLHRKEEQHIDAIAPLAAGGELIGVLVLESVDTTSPQFRRMLQLLANVSALAIKNARLFQRIAEMARHDGLTGLLNHASFQEHLRELVDHAQCAQRPLTLIMSDVDNFKSINDAYGHPIGDQVLREVARTWKKIAPEDAVVARYGGEEFVCAVLGMDLEQASELAEAMRSTIEVLPLSFDKGVLSVTASFGVAELGQPARNATELIRLADDALYQSKRSGRNCVTLVPTSMCVAGRSVKSDVGTAKSEILAPAVTP